jgi:N utilization substance protein B
VVQDSSGPGRREARERTVQILYEADTRAIDPTEVLAELQVEPDPFAVDLVTGVAANRDEVDSILERLSEGWALSRMPPVDRAILRLATFELGHHPEIPSAVVLSEAVELAKQYSTADSGRFVNGLLANVAVELRDVPSAAQDDD